MDAALVVGLVELLKWAIRDLCPDCPDWLWPLLAVAIAVGLEIGTDGLSWDSILAGIRLGLTVSGLYRAAMYIARARTAER